ncbi:MAG: HNH endonuclease [Planctomycetaceae bacterium]|jgi:5-methylcytosine-specific restriction endonuclease McrA|nr:HNH endonuclease [Planctomycetaceae bacterium]
MEKKSFEDGNNYPLLKKKPKPNRLTTTLRQFSLLVEELNRYKDEYGDEFNIKVHWWYTSDDFYFYQIPYGEIKDLLDKVPPIPNDKNKPDQNLKWTAHIYQKNQDQHELTIHRSGVKIPCLKYYHDDPSPEDMVWLDEEVPPSAKSLLSPAVKPQQAKSPPPRPSSEFDDYKEGTRALRVRDDVYRNPKARKKCLERYGYNCSVCGFNFEEGYGEIGKGLIHVHHLNPISKSEGKHKINLKDLRPVCPNCHAMLHSSEPPLSIEDLQRHLKFRWESDNC